MELGRIIESKGRRQKGVALIIALLLLIAIGITSAVSMRSALFGDLVSHNMRSQNLALAAAEIALRYCEQQAGIFPTPAGFNVIDLNNPTPAVNNEWQLAGGFAAANTVPPAWLGDTVDYATRPDCIVRRMTYDEAYGAAAANPGVARPEDRGVPPAYVFVFRVTARGYSPDYEVDGNGNPVSGAEVRLQSMLRGIL